MRFAVVLLIAWTVWPAYAQEVTMPLKAFDALRAKAKAVEAVETEAPVPWALERVDLQMHLRGEAVHTRQIADLVLWSEGWQDVPLPLVGSPMEVDWGGLEGRLHIPGSLAEAVLKVRGAGRHRVEIRSVTNLQTAEDAERSTRFWQLKSPMAGAVGGFIQLEHAEQEVSFGNGLRVAPVQGLLTATEISGRHDLALAQGREITLRVLGPRVAPDLNNLPPRWNYELSSTLEVGRTGVSLSAFVVLNVLQGRLESSDFAIPEGFEVASVEGDDQGWDVKDGILTVFWQKRDYGFTIQVEMKGTARDRLDDPILRPIQGEVRRHLISATTRGDGLLELENAEVLRSATHEDKRAVGVGGDLFAGRAFALKDPSTGPVWTVVWADSARVLSTQIDRLLIDVLVGRSGRAAYQFWAEVRNRGSGLLKIRPPRGFQWVSASRDGSPLVPGLSQAGTSQGDGESLAIAVDSGDQSRAIHLLGSIDLPLPDRDGVLKVPIPELSAPVARVEVRVSLPPGAGYKLREPSRRGAVGLPPRQEIDRENLLQTNQMASQLAQYVPETAVSEGELWLVPSGFSQVQAVWSALSPTPQPLQIVVETEREGSSWF